jgi:hypothetical protein
MGIAMDTFQQNAVICAVLLETPSPYHIARGKFIIRPNGAGNALIAMDGCIYAVKLRTWALNATQHVIKCMPHGCRLQGIRLNLESSGKLA